VPTHVSALPAALPAHTALPTPGATNRRRVPALLALLTALLGSLLVVGAAPAGASTPGASYIQEASRHHGQPYHYGSAGPNRFDCSGFTLYVFGRFGKRLPHSSSAQYNAVRHVAKTAKQAGDLVFFRDSSGYIGHVGIYAGNGKMWDAPRSGDVVRLRALYSSNYVVGRV
jgi:cell wall-associated NlpC family hydrolase